MHKSPCELTNTWYNILEGISGQKQRSGKYWQKVNNLVTNRDYLKSAYFRYHNIYIMFLLLNQDKGYQCICILIISLKDKHLFHDGTFRNNGGFWQHTLTKQLYPFTKRTDRFNMNIMSLNVLMLSQLTDAFRQGGHVRPFLIAYSGTAS